MEEQKSNGILERIAELKQVFSTSDRQFCKLIDFPYQTFNHYFCGKREPSLKLVMCILDKFPQVSAEWLMRGNGAMMLDGYNEDGMLNTSCFPAIEEFDKLKAVVDAANEAVKQANAAVKAHEEKYGKL